MNKKVKNNDFLEGLEHLSDDDKKWALLFWVYICSGENGINKIIDFTERMEKRDAN